MCCLEWTTTAPRKASDGGGLQGRRVACCLEWTTTAPRKASDGGGVQGRRVACCLQWTTAAPRKASDGGGVCCLHSPVDDSAKKCQQRRRAGPHARATGCVLSVVDDDTKEHERRRRPMRWRVQGRRAVCCFQWTPKLKKRTPATTAARSGRRAVCGLQWMTVSLDASWLSPVRAEPEKSPSQNSEPRASSRLPASCKTELGPSFPKARCSSVQIATQAPLVTARRARGVAAGMKTVDARRARRR